MWFCEIIREEKREKMVWEKMTEINPQTISVNYRKGKKEVKIDFECTKVGRN